MARDFDAASSEYLGIDSAVVTAAPFTMACWVKLDQLPSSYGDELTAISLSHPTTDQFFNLRADDATDAAQFTVLGGAATSAADVTAGVWEHYCGVSRASDDRSVFLNGGNEGVDAFDRTPAGIARTRIGGLLFSGAMRDFMDGAIAEAAIWNVVLTDAEVAILAKGYSPLFVRPQNLVAYWPLIRDTDDDIVGGYSMTAFNTPTVVPHPPVLYPGRALLGLGAAAPPPVGQPMQLRGIMVPHLRQWQPRAFS